MTGRARPALAVLAVVVLTAAILVACGSSGRVAEGVVLTVEPAGPVKVARFTLRTKDGSMLTFRIGQLELDGNAFPADHLAVHQLTAQPVAVAYREEAGELVAYRLVDAPWAQ